MIFNMLSWKNYLFAVALVAALYGLSLLGKRYGKGPVKQRTPKQLAPDGRSQGDAKMTIPVIPTWGTDPESFFLETAELTERLCDSVSSADRCQDKKKLIRILRALVAEYPRMNQPVFQKAIRSVITRKLTALDCHQYTDHDLEKIWVKDEP